MAEAVGPVYTGGFEAITAGEGGRYAILYLPDKHNDDLQREGKPAVYYWMPNYVRLARKGDVGDYKFHLIHFVGVQSSDSTVGVEGKREVAGGVLSLTTTAAFPASVMQQAQEELLNRFRGKDLKYWGWRSPAAPMFRPIPIMANVTSITNLSPNSDGSIPAGGGEAGPRMMRSDDLNKPVPHGPAFRGPGGLDAWYFKLQGQGPGSIVPTGENAYSGMMGSLPTAILWQGFHGSYSPVAVTQALKLKLWSQTLRIKIEGNWDKVFEHFSAAAQGRAWWFSGDIKTEFNNMRTNGTIKVDLEIDGTIPSSDKMREAVDKRVDQILAKFMEQAQKMIFDPAPPDVKPAEAPSGGGGLFGFLSPYGGGFALKYRRDTTRLNLSYDETRSEQYLQDHVISSTLEGFYDEIKRDAQAEKKYFTTLYLDDWDRKVTRNVQAVANWPDATRKWVGDPVAWMSCQIGYPSARGDIQWTGRQFAPVGGAEPPRWDFAAAKKNAADVVTPPQGWTPDKTYVKRMVHYYEPPGETDSPYMRVFVEQNEVKLDPEPNGTLTNDFDVEVRADSVGKLEIGPISLNVNLENANQIVEVEFQALGKKADGTDRAVTRFSFKYDDLAEPRYWEIFTGQKDFKPQFRYRVRVVVKGSLFTDGMEWQGPWVDWAGNGPLMVSVPKPDGQGVTRRSLTSREIMEEGLPARADVTAPTPSAPAAPAGDGAVPPPIGAPMAGAPVAGAPSGGGAAPPPVERISRGMDLEALRSGYTPDEERSVAGYGVDDSSFPPPPTDGVPAAPNGYGPRTAREDAPEPAAASPGRLEELPVGARWRPE